ncbi:MAG: 2-oxoacid:acceptor oxidoreductase family protein, partial [Acidobacteria bacterium]|nr:2-oxoacid:acceptor oxidoreductase family protein [Acidobacteriota bacterium]
TGEHIRKRVLAGPERLLDAAKTHTRHGRNLYIDATRLAESLFGSHLAVNTFLMGVAFQAGLLPVSEASLEEAIRLNGVEVERNLQVFLWGRKYYQDAAFVEALLHPFEGKQPGKLDRVEELRRYQSSAYAREYQTFVRQVEQQAPALAEPVARYLYKLMAYKDEYEVARLLTRPEIEQQILAMWEQPESICYNLHPPLLRRFGVTKKLELGPWFRTPLKILAAMKFLRGTPLDVFGYMGRRRLERSLIGWYRELISTVTGSLSPDFEALAVEIACLPDQIRGYEQVKEESIARVKKLAGEKLARMRAMREERVAT